MGFLLFAAKAIPWIVGLIGGVYATKKVTESFGSTPINNVRQIPGMETMTPKQLFNERKEWRKNKDKYHESKDEKIQSEIDKLNKKFELENEETSRLSKELNKAREEGDKETEKRVLVALEQQKSKVDGIAKQIRGLEKEKKENQEKRDKVHESFDDGQSQEQFVSSANAIDWTSYKNYAIIFICIVVVIMVIGLIKKLLGSLMKSVN